MIDPNEIKTAVELLDKSDAEQWDAPGRPRLEVIRRLMGNDAVTDQDIDSALGTGKAGEPAKTAKPKVARPVEAVAEDNRPDMTGPGSGTGGLPTQPDGNPDRIAKLMQEVGVLKATFAEKVKPVEDLERQRADLDAKIAAGRKEVEKLQEKIEAGTAIVTDAEIIKRIQANTQATLMARSAALAKVADAMKLTGQKIYASPLDAALATGAKRSKVLVGGVMVEAPHPRSAQGIRNMATWIHGNRPQAQ